MRADSTQFPALQLFSSDWITFGFFLAGILVLVLFTEVAQKKRWLSPETSRKWVHVLVGIMVCGSPFLMTVALPAILLGSIFIVLNIVAILVGALNGIHGTERSTLGTVFYPVSFLILVLVFWSRDPLILVLSFLIMAIGDPMAAVVGENIKSPRRFILWKDSKSLQGSFTLGIIAFIITVVGLYFSGRFPGARISSGFALILSGLSVAAISVVSEAVSKGGSDNLTLPLSAALTLDILLHGGTIRPEMFFLWCSVAFFFAWLAYRLQVLTQSGAAVAFLLGSFIFGIGGLHGLVPLATFFVFSSVFSKIGKKKKYVLENVYEKTGNRDMMQVLANGGIAGIMMTAWHFLGGEIFYYGFLGALAAATADTWATELGILSNQQPRSILTFRQVPGGTSGGITVMGTTGALLGAGVITFSGWLLPATTLQSLFQGSVFAAIVFAGFTGALADSIVGATLQAQYRCPVCNKITEKRLHCENTTAQLEQGHRWINNDVVNLFCTAVGTGLTLIFLV